MKRTVMLAILVMVLLVALSACGGRDTGTPEKALVGHWSVRGENTELYFNAGGHFDATGLDAPGKGTWQVLEDVSEGSTIAVEITPDNKAMEGLDLVLNLSEDYQTARCTFPVTEAFLGYLDYVDDATGP